MSVSDVDELTSIGDAEGSVEVVAAWATLDAAVVAAAAAVAATAVAVVAAVARVAATAVAVAAALAEGAAIADGASMMDSTESNGVKAGLTETPWSSTS